MKQPSLKLVLTLATALCGVVSCSGQQAPARYPVTSAAIASALTAAGALVTAADVTLPSALTTAAPSPQFTLQAIGLSGPAQLRVRVACAQPGQCLPFLVVADLHNPAAASAAQQKLAPPSASGRFTQQAAGDTLRAGQHATLLLENAHMRISLPVISIDTGAPGNEIRVASLDRKQTWRATVTDATNVRGALP